MRIFVYKTLFIFVCIFLLFQLTIGSKIREIEGKMHKFKSKENVEVVKNKIRNEIKSASEKDSYLTPEDALLINKFFTKLKSILATTNVTKKLISGFFSQNFNTC